MNDGDEVVELQVTREWARELSGWFGEVFGSCAYTEGGMVVDGRYVQWGDSVVVTVTKGR